MPRRRPFAIAAAAVAISAALTGCGGSNGANDADSTPSATPTPSADPYAFSYVPYPSYKEAARQTGLRPDVVKRELGFQTGIAALCRSLPADFTILLDELRKESSTKDEPGNTLQAMIDEVSLRLGLACKTRMSDWISAGGGTATPTEDPDSFEFSDPSESPDPSATGEPTGAADSESDSESGGFSTTEPEYEESNFGPARLDGLTSPDVADEDGSSAQE